MSKVSCTAVLPLVVVSLTILGCGGASPATLADLAGEWKNEAEEYPSLSIKENGEGFLAVTVSDGSQMSLSMSRIAIKQEEGKFFFNHSLTDSSGYPHDFRYELEPTDSKTLILKTVDTEQPQQFTMRRE